MLDIYKTRYRFNDHPFRLNPDYRFSLDHPSYARAKAYLKYAISQGEGFIAITGEPGTGKTTLINGLLAELEKAPVLVASLTYAQLDPRHLIQMVATAFGLTHKEGSPALLLPELEQFLIRQGRNDRHAVLIVDEAQGMSAESLEELRLLSNLHHGNRLLMQIFLVGQDQLMEIIHAPGMEHLQQRLIAASHLEPLHLEETVDYVEHRLCHVGWQGDPAISEGALRLIHRFSAGVPRRINLICHRLFLHGGLEHLHELGGKDVLHVVEELRKERVLPAGTSSGDSPDEELDAVTGDSGAPAPGLPRRETPFHTGQTGQAPGPGQPERPMAAEPRPHDAPPATNGSRLSESEGERIDTGTGDSRNTPKAAESQPDAGPDATAVTAGGVAENSQPGTHVSSAPPVHGHGDPGSKGLKRSVWRMLGIMLLPVLLLALLITMDNETGRRIRDALANLTHYSNPGEEMPELPVSGRRQVLGEGALPESEVTTEADTAASDTVSAVAPPVASQDGHPADDGRKKPVPDPVRGAAGRLPARDAEPDKHSTIDIPTAAPAQMTDTAVSGRTDSGPVFSGLEAELAANDMPAARLDDNSLKLNLSSTAMFELNSTRLGESAATSLNKFAEVMRKYDGISIRIVGHTDSSGHPEYNLRLSQRRAEAVANYLVRMGLPADRIQWMGRGDLDTRFEAATQEQPELRRRVELYFRATQPD